jgi:chromosomal replication initiation ATPase DnaA
VIASAIKPNVRELAYALIRLAAYARRQDRPAGLRIGAPLAWM